MGVSGAPSGRPAPSGSGPGAQDAQRSLLMLLTLPVAVIAGFVLAKLMGLGTGADGWTVWLRIAVLAVIISTPSAVGAALGRRAGRQGSTPGTVGLALNLVFGLFLIATTVVAAIESVRR